MNVFIIDMYNECIYIGDLKTSHCGLVATMLARKGRDLCSIPGGGMFSFPLNMLQFAHRK